MLHPVCGQESNDLNGADGMESHPVPVMLRQALPEANLGDDSAAERQQIIDMISEGCPNAQEC